MGEMTIGKRIDLTDQVAIVTGAGRGIGRAHAVMLAERGAAVVVNDTGSQLDGRGGDNRTAEEVVSEIEAAGGSALASTDDISTPAGGEGVVDRAIRSFGKVDIFIHNAGILRTAPFADMQLADVHDVLNVHLMAAWHVGQPAWRDMASRRYGRIILTSSGAVYGHPNIVPYAVAKAGLIGMAKCLQSEALLAGLDIRTNVVAPVAATRMGSDRNRERFGALNDPAAVAAVVVYLSSRECTLGGETVQAGASHFARVFIGQTIGWARRHPGVTSEEIRDHLQKAFDLTDFRCPESAEEMTDLVYEFVVPNGRRLEGESSASNDS